jgi:predicted DNA-binding WGR domain protein
MGRPLMQPVRMVCQDGSHNKYYFMDDKGDGTWTATYGRIGTTVVTYNYNISQWNKKLNEKIRKRYVRMEGLDKRLGDVVRTPDNQNSVIVAVGNTSKGIVADDYIVEYENGNRKNFSGNELTRSYLDSKLMTHRAFYAHLIDVQTRVTGGQI